MSIRIIPQKRARPMTANTRAYHLRRCAATVDRIWQAAKDGKISRSQLGDIVTQRGKGLDKRLATYRHYGFDLPEITDDKPRRGSRPMPAYATPARLDPDGCLALAATLLAGAIGDVRAGRDVAEAVAFLWSDRAGLFFDSLGVDRDWAMDEMEGHLCDE